MKNFALTTDLLKLVVDIESTYSKLNKDRLSLDKTENDAFELINELLNSQKDS